MTEINTVTKLRRAIRDAKNVFVQPRFGVSERWIKITKKEALDMTYDLIVQGVGLTPDEAEMFTGTFGDMTDNENLYLG